MLSRIIGNALPEETQHNQVPVLPMNARTPQFDNLTAERLEYLEFKLLSGVITEIILGVNSCLKAVRADNSAGRQVLNNQVIAHGIKWIFISAGGIRFGQTFFELEIENFESQRLSSSDFIRVSHQTRCVLRGRSNH